MINQKFSKFQAFEQNNAFGIDLSHIEKNDESVDIELTPETLKTVCGSGSGSPTTRVHPSKVRNVEQSVQQRTRTAVYKWLRQFRQRVP